MILDLVDVYQDHSPQKKSLQNSTHNFGFEVCLQFSYFVTYIFWHKYISHV
jgi:hypothetical protein